MGRSKSNRGMSDRSRRAVAAGIVVVAHVALVCAFVFMRVPLVREGSAEAVIAELIDKPRPRNLSLGPVPIHVELEKVLHVQRLAPRIPDIPVEVTEPTQTEVTIPLQASAPVPQPTDAGLDGEARDASGHSGGGYSVTLLQRVIPLYPAAAARNREEGVTQAMLHVDSSGRVDDVKVTRSSGSRSLDKAAVDAFRKWKFASLSSQAPPEGVWLRTEQRFIYYRVKYSRLAGGAADNVHVAEVRPASEQPTPGSQAALQQFISAVSAGALPQASDFAERLQYRKMRDALDEWGDVKSIEFTGMAGEQKWTAYRTRSEAGSSSTVEVGWNMFEVRHQHATTEWLIAVDRNGRLWSASASQAPWM
jgi:protein TonB